MDGWDPWGNFSCRFGAAKRRNGKRPRRCAARKEGARAGPGEGAGFPGAPARRPQTRARAAGGGHDFPRGKDRPRARGAGGPGRGSRISRRACAPRTKGSSSAAPSPSFQRSKRRASPSAIRKIIFAFTSKERSPARRTCAHCAPSKTACSPRRSKSRGEKARLLYYIIKEKKKPAHPRSISRAAARKEEIS